jgi:glycosyltransferase involved in cell wall biosynthesis
LNGTLWDKLRVCYTNIDANQWVFDAQKRRVVRSRLNISDQDVVLLFPARLVEQKRPLFLVDIIQALTELSPSIVVVVVGKGHLQAQMQARVNALGLNSVFRFLMRAEPTEMQDYYSASDILLLPSAYEGIALSIFEAMAM